MRFNALQCASMRFNALLIAFLLFCAFPSFAQNDCGTNFDLKKLKKDHAAYQEFLRIEQLTEAYRARMAGSANQRLIDENGIITIPIVFHVLHLGEAVGTGTNLSDARLIDQVEVLNAAYSQTNNQADIPEAFRNVAGNPNFRFALACVAPNGAGTNGIVRRQTTPDQQFTTVNQSAKRTAQNGDDPWATDRYLNVWITPNLSSPEGLLFGYSQFPNRFALEPNTDGVVIWFEAIGRGAGTNPVRSQGHTLAHEIGHWLNIIHLFDNGCAGNDFCNDTPLQQNPTFNFLACNTITFPRNASPDCTNINGDMFDNFMDNTNENCGRRMFTRDQAIRMRAVFQPGGPRRGFIDNYFAMVNVYRSCTSNYFRVNTPFCAAQGNITWNVTGPATGGNTNQILATFSNPSTANGVATVTASWDNYTTSQDIQVGYGNESSYIVPTCNNDYTTPYPMSDGTNTIVCPNSGMVGELQFSGATGPATSMTLVSTNSSYVSFNANGNNFNLYMSDLYSFAQIQAVIPTLCGNRTVNYYFFANIPNGPNPYFYRVSPNPASNNITVSASRSINGTASRVIDSYEYEAQVFNAFGQLMKKKKNIRGEGDVDINVANFPSNQFYTVKLISGTDVQTQRFFKQ